MELLEALAFPMLSIWFLGLLLVFFRKDLEAHWKFFFFLVFCFYFVQFFPEFSEGASRWKQNPKLELRNGLLALGNGMYVFLFLLWPFVLIRIFYSASGNLSKSLIPVLAYGTVLYWVGFFVWTVYSKEINTYLETIFITK